MTTMPVGENVLQDVSLLQAADALRVSSKTPLRVLSSAAVGDDLALTRNIVAMSVRGLEDSTDAEVCLHEWAMHAGIQEPFVGLVTTGITTDYQHVVEKAPKWTVSVLLLMDLANRCAAGISEPDEGNDHGSIDIIILTDASLSMGAMVAAMVTATEAKVRVLAEHQVTTPDGHVATSAPRDTVVIACLSKGERIRQAGATTPFGFLTARAVQAALSSALKRQQPR